MSSTADILHCRCNWKQLKKWSVIRWPEFPVCFIHSMSFHGWTKWWRLCRRRHFTPNRKRCRANKMLLHFFCRPIERNDDISRMIIVAKHNPFHSNICHSETKIKGNTPIFSVFDHKKHLFIDLSRVQEWTCLFAFICHHRQHNNKNNQQHNYRAHAVHLLEPPAMPDDAQCTCTANEEQQHNWPLATHSGQMNRVEHAKETEKKNIEKTKHWHNLSD